jgi:hypothetical protein
VRCSKQLWQCWQWQQQQQQQQQQQRASARAPHLLPSKLQTQQPTSPAAPHNSSRAAAAAKPAAQAGGSAAQGMRMHRLKQQHPARLQQEPQTQAFNESCTVRQLCFGCCCSCWRLLQQQWRYLQL